MIAPWNRDKNVAVTYATDLRELREIVEDYDADGWDLVAMTEKAGYTLVFRRRKE